MAKIEETWFLTLTLPELEWLEIDTEGCDPGTLVAGLREKILIALDAARNWNTTLSELPVTPSRGELPDA